MINCVYVCVSVCTVCVCVCASDGQHLLIITPLLYHFDAMQLVPRRRQLRYQLLAAQLSQRGQK